MNGFPSPVPRGYSTIVPRAIFSTLPRGNFPFLSTSFFFDSSSQNYRGFCSRQLVETAWLQGLLSRFSLLFPPLQNSRGSPKRRLRCRNRRCRKSPDFRLPPNRALSRCRSPFSLQLLPAISARCRHCRRLFPMRPPAGICEFCRNHWFSREDRPYHFCEACGSFHWARYPRGRGDRQVLLRRHERAFQRGVSSVAVEPSTPARERAGKQTEAGGFGGSGSETAVAGGVGRRVGRRRR